MANKVYVFSRGEFDSLPLDFLKDKAIIKVHSMKDREWFPSTVKNGIVLFFNDLKIYDLGFFDKLKAYYSDKRYSYFIKADALKILSFINKCKRRDIVIHCQFGNSISVAIAMYLRDNCKYTIQNKNNDELNLANDWVIKLLKKYE